MAEQTHTLPKKGHVMAIQMNERPVRAVSMVSVVVVALVAAYVSYRHAYGLALSVGEDPLSSAALPLSIDGLVLSSSMVLLRNARLNSPVPKRVRFCLALGILATLAVNLTHGAPWSDHLSVKLTISAWPAMALVGSFEMLMSLLRGTHQKTPEEPVEWLSRPSTADLMEDDSDEAWSKTRIPEEAPEPVTLAGGLRALPTLPPEASSPRWDQAVKLYREALDTGEEMTRSELARRLGMKSRGLARAAANYVEHERK